MARLVIAEDHADLRTTFSRALTRAGHQVVACADGDSALVRIRTERPDLVVTDVDMPPGMSGLDMLVAIRADPDIAAVPVVVVTGGRIHADAAAALGATLLLHKPIAPRTLVAHVHAILVNARGTAAETDPAT